MSIPTEAIDAAARALWENGSSANPRPWNEAGDGLRDRYRMFAIAALSAALPLIEARAKAEALEQLAVSFEATASCASYISTEDIMETWLNAAQRARAAVKGVTP